MTDFQQLSEHELQSVIDNAQKALKNKQANKHKEIIAQIKELAASIGATVDIYEGNKKVLRKGAEVPIKYRHPDDPNKAWKGRGMMPKWMKELLDSGRDRSEFEV